MFDGSQVSLCTYLPVGYDTKSVFKLCLTGFNTGFSFCYTEIKKLSLPY